MKTGGEGTVTGVQENNEEVNAGVRNACHVGLEGDLPAFSPSSALLLPFLFRVHHLTSPVCPRAWLLQPLPRCLQAARARNMLANSASVRILIKGGKVVNDDCTHEADVYIENGIIQQVGRELMIPGGAKVVDATGKLVIPGGIDTSTHFHQTFMNATCVDDFYSGTKQVMKQSALTGSDLLIEYQTTNKCQDEVFKSEGVQYGAVGHSIESQLPAALVGGTTMIIGHVLPDKETSLVDAYEKCRSLADPKVCCDYALHVGITWWAPKLEVEATHRVITIANRTHCPIYLVNVSSISAGDVIAAAKMQGKVVLAETTTAHATLTGLHYYHQDWSHAAAYVTVPPLRLDTNTSTYLMSLLANDTLNIVASDHRPFTTKQKAMGKEDFTKIPHGVSGVQDRMSVIWERGVVGGKMDENRFVAVTSSNAAKILNLYPRKGRVIPGADADVVVWDPEATKTISASTQVQGGDFNLYESMRCHGVPLVTISRGRVVYENGVFMCAEGTGKFCPLRSFPDTVYKKLVQREKTLKVRGVDRTPYLGDVAVVVHPGKKEMGTPLADTPTRPVTRHGGMRDLHESSFSLSGSQIDDHVPKRASARILAPPGGRSSGIW
ncbi:Dihydropyrimidinase-related protein 5 [Fukomys damarensis]|uniref:Dihydropyrimidinase-related protein 5 n=1 Tax=Fukomys damarensis TaxID=885580 RepID=A0A091CXC1_FUKDA|nr:Dihydropyrimidinase-related protein 5 [Fukomys damarensis]